MLRPLVPRQRLFADQYLIDLNGKEAAIRAGYGAKDAASRAAKLLRRAEIKAAIRAAMDARAVRTGIAADRVLDEYAAIAFANMRDFADWGPPGRAVRCGEAPVSREYARYRRAGR